MSDGFSRRHFFFGALLAGAVPSGGYGSVASLKQLGYKSPNEKLNLAAIGAGGQPLADLIAAEAGVENVVALTDCDWNRGAAGFARYPKAAKYKDFRKMLDQSGKEIDAVVAGPADHMHATCALACMRAGKHVYCEKPLTHSAWEARLLAQAAEKYKVATQMGNQGYSHDATRVACEIIWSGEIGDVTEVHGWYEPPGWPQGMQKIPPPTPVPETLDWDLWLGCAAWRPYTAGDDEYRAYAVSMMSQRSAASRGVSTGSGQPPGASAARGSSAGSSQAPGPGRAQTPGRSGGMSAAWSSDYGFYLPFNWRGFCDFGTGLFGDWGVHIFGPANWALQLHPKYLISIEVLKREGTSPFNYPLRNSLKWEFAARGGMPPVTIYWSDGVWGDDYLPPGMSGAEARKIPGQGPQVGPAQGQGGFFIGGGSSQAGRAPSAPAAGGGPRAGGSQGGRGSAASQTSGYNCIFAGSKGYMGTSGRGEGVGLLPGSRWAEYKLPNAYLPRSPGASTGANHNAHLHDWIRACKGGVPGCSNFSIAGPYTEWVVLGAVATHFEGKLLWNYDKMEFTNNKEASKWIKPVFRKGWELKL